MGTLLVAAGGGGDAITASVLAPILGAAETPGIMTYSWDRLIIDPLPGPRIASDFTGLRQLHPDVLEILPSSQTVSPAGSSLPRLAAELSARLLLLDPTGGAVGMAAQLDAAASLFDADGLALVDVGGDALTRGTEAGLRSPLADLLAIAACTLTGRPVQLLIPAPGVDGELTEATLLTRLADLHSHQVAIVSADDVRPVRSIFNWHPSEASGLFAAAAYGARGSVEVRDAGCQVHLTDNTPAVFALDAHELAATSPAAALWSTTTLDQADQVISQLTGVSEISYETAKAARLRHRRPYLPTHADLVTIDRHAADAQARGADYVTVRRLAELVGVTSEKEFTAFRTLLADRRADRYQPPLYHVSRPSCLTQA
ncbi:MAG: DUF1152 domain-containing protein [Pseudonocardiaceae bacterium]